MIHGQYAEPYTFYTTTEEKRIDKAVPSSQIRFLFKFTNGMDRNVVYAYGQNQLVNNRYTKVNMTPNSTENVYTGNIDFEPNGYWEYEVYEVSWQDAGTPTLATGFAPINETDVLSPASDDKGVVQGRVEIGKLYIKEGKGKEEVQYKEYVKPTQTNYIYVS
ncbi:MAG: hypothetical protein P8H37_11115 [Paracoccaceae bacterium]|nr:hypothetical protein [Paracoccaceae bacterium]